MFTSPFAQVEIKNNKGDVWDFVAPHYPFLTDVNVTLNIGTAGTGWTPSFSFSLDAPFEDGLRLLDEDPSPFAIGNVVKVRVGYLDGGGISPWYYGRMDNGGDGLTLTPDGLTGSISCQTMPYMTWYDLNVVDLKGLSNWYDILEMIAGKLGCEYKASVRVNNFKYKGQLSVPGGMNAGDALNIAREALPVEIWMDQGAVDSDVRTLYVMLKQETASGEEKPKPSKPRNTYIMRGAYDLNKHQYPCLEWSPEGGNITWWDALEPSGAAAGVTAYGIDTETGDVAKGDGPPSEIEIPLKGGSAKGDPQENVIDGHIFDQPTTDGELPQKVSVAVPEGGDGESALEQEAKQKQQNESSAQQGVINSLGVPEEYPGNLCNLLGCGRRYDGVYKVMKMTHAFSGGNFETSLSVLVEGSGGSGTIEEVTDGGAGVAPEKVSE